MTEPSNRAGRRKLLALVALFVVPLLAAGVWYALVDWVRPQASAHGTLIEPARPLDEFAVATLADADSRYDLDDLRGHWTLVHIIDARCAAACRERIHYTRQIRDALGHDRVRVRRLAIVPPAATGPGLAGLLPEHPDLIVVRGEAALIEQLPADRSPVSVFLVDPLGNLMMRFDGDVEPRGIRHDLERLLRISRIG